MPGTGTGLTNTYLKMSRKYELKDKDKGPSFSTNVYYIFITFGKVKSVVSRNMAVRTDTKKKNVHSRYKATAFRNKNLLMERPREYGQHCSICNQQPIFNIDTSCIINLASEIEWHYQLCACMHARRFVRVVQSEEVSECLCTFHMTACVGLKALQPKMVMCSVS